MELLEKEYPGNPEEAIRHLDMAFGAMILQNVAEGKSNDNIDVRMYNYVSEYFEQKLDAQVNTG